ncbi:hypothetical protein PISMIDRAFT_211033 [Pisolithus microcarpus 441]|uniref:F-box domain-containing protein n=1 Tax=Pisolithus microcarpus 441 TaxID=765257 RepID=A0A0C9YV18_9AGAM|nr:hypothetical protein PISMIDRAFT_211033 [Pisolithus microcarpus 441]
MAAKGSHHLPHPPCFPVELWQKIFELATHVPYTLVPELYEKSDCIRDQHSALEASLVTKRSLVLVCKQWQYMAMRYFYCIVLIRTGLDLLALDRALRNYATGNGGCVGTRSPGQWTRRLDITLDLSDESECEELDRCVMRLADVIKSLPKLEIVSFAIPDSLGPEPDSVIMPFRVLDALRRSANSLRILDWSGDDFFPQVHQLEELLRDLPYLRVLRCRQLVWANGILPSSILSSLTTLAVEDLVERVGHPGEGDLHEACVSLKEFIYYGVYRQFPRGLLIRYGKYLTTVKLYGTDSRWFREALDPLHEHCPNLDRLIFCHSSLSSYDITPLQTWSFPRISYLGVKIEDLDFSDLLRFLEHLRNKVPTLRVFQIICPRVVEELLKERLWASALADLNEIPFRVEDDRGNLLSDRFLESPSGHAIRNHPGIWYVDAGVNQIYGLTCPCRRVSVV